MSKKKRNSILNKVKKILLANRYVTVNDVYNTEGVKVRTQHFSDYIRLLVDVDSSKFQVEDIFPLEDLEGRYNLAPYLIKKYNINIDNLSKKDRDYFNELAYNIVNEYYKNVNKSFNEMEKNPRDIERSKILAAILKGFLIEEVEQIKILKQNFIKLIEEEMQKFVNKIKTS